MLGKKVLPRAVFQHTQCHDSFILPILVMQRMLRVIFYLTKPSRPNFFIHLYMYSLVRKKYYCNRVIHTVLCLGVFNIRRFRNREWAGAEVSNILTLYYGNKLYCSRNWRHFYFWQQLVNLHDWTAFLQPSVSNTGNYSLIREIIHYNMASNTSCFMTTMWLLTEHVLLTR